MPMTVILCYRFAYLLQIISAHADLYKRNSNDNLHLTFGLNTSKNLC